MNINGIIAEYNPFHNGHKYQLAESRRRTGADYTIVVMSGNFVQRGAPALVPKTVRTEMALQCGADLVLELPTLYASASSEYFAAGAVALLDKLAVVTHLCFGSDCGDITALRQVAAFLAAEPAEYRMSLKCLLKQGFSYPDARAKALLAASRETGGKQHLFLAESADAGTELFPFTGHSADTSTGQLPFSDDSGNTCTKQLLFWEDSAYVSRAKPPFRLPLPENSPALLSSPNNILAIDYIKEIIRRKSIMIPFTIKREGSGYHDTLLNAVPKSPSPVSALAIRQALQKGQSCSEMYCYMPEEALKILEAHLIENRTVYTADFSGILYYKLLTERAQGYESYLDVSPDLSNRIRNGLNLFTDFESYCDLLKTKAFTHTRISRCLLHILLNIRKEDMMSGQAMDNVPYARVLGFRRSAEPLLQAIKANSAVPLLTKPADACKKLPPEAERLFQQDILASEIYKGVAYAKTSKPAPNEFSTPLIIL